MTTEDTTREDKPRLWLRLLLMIVFMAVIAGVLGYIKFGVQIPELTSQGATAATSNQRYHRPGSNRSMAKPAQGNW